jgi:hypothetical protein
MGFHVDPDALRAAGKGTAAAAGDLRPAKATSRNAEAAASEIHYQPAAGMAEAVAQKAGASLALMAAVLDGLTTGLGNAADAYVRTDRLKGPR